jgi:Tfp pilus assembly protein PilZ
MTIYAGSCRVLNPKRIKAIQGRIQVMEEERKQDDERIKQRFKIYIQDTEHKVNIIDISSTGIHIETTNKYHMGDTCTLSINPGAPGETTTLSGKIVWGKLQEKQSLNEEDTFEYGLVFQPGNNISEQEIIELIMHVMK